MKLEDLVKLADRLCEVRFPRKPHWCPFWPDCGCVFSVQAKRTPQEETSISRGTDDASSRSDG